MVKVPFTISCCPMGFQMDVDICRSVELWDGNDRMHCSLEVCDPIVESVVKPLSPQACEVCEEEEVEVVTMRGTAEFSAASQTDQFNNQRACFDRSEVSADLRKDCLRCFEKANLRVLIAKSFHR